MKPIVDAIPAKGGFGKKQEKYKAEHDSEIRQFYAVKRKLDNAGLPGKKLTPKQWQAELEMLMEQYAAETAELKPVYSDLKNCGIFPFAKLQLYCVFARPLSIEILRVIFGEV